MGQDAIWNYYQNNALEQFRRSEGRLSYLCRILIRLGCTRVLDIGIGDGTFERLAMENGIQVYGLDPDEQSITRIGSQMGITQNLKVGYSRSIPFGDETFDAVVMSEVIEHLDEADLDPTLGEAHRVLKRRGFFVGTVPANERLEDSITVCPSCNHIFHRWGHQRSFTETSLTQLLRSRFGKVVLFRRHLASYVDLSPAASALEFIKTILSTVKIYGKDDSYIFYASK